MVLRKVIKKPALVPRKNCLLNHHFSPRLLHACLEQCYYISDLSELYITPYR